MLNWLKNLFQSPKPISVQYAVLEKDHFILEYHKAFEKLNLQSEAQQKSFRDQVFAVQGAVEKALRRKWKPTNDFEVGWDFNDCYHTCGGIYSESIFCREYVETVANTLQSLDPEGRWTYHTACEICVDGSVESRGEFFVRGGTCYIDGSSMTRAWRALLGSHL